MKEASGSQKRGCGRTGPRTVAGKAISSGNASQHCLCSKKILVTGDDPAEWQRLHEMWFEAYPPADDREGQLVQEAAESDWIKRRSMRRCEELEEALASKKALEWTEEEHKTYERFLRYKTTNERAAMRNLQTLQQRRRERMQAERAAAADEPEERKENTAIRAHEANTDKPSYQMVYVSVLDGKTVTELCPENEVMGRIAADKEPGTVIIRVFQFPSKLPPEYAWVVPTRFNEDGSIAVFRQKMDVPTWFRTIAREEATGTGLLGPVETH